jgi:hypothetical protein
VCNGNPGPDYYYGGGFCPFVFYNTWLKRVETEKYDTMLIKGVRKLEKQDSGDV